MRWMPFFHLSTCPTSRYKVLFKQGCVALNFHFTIVKTVRGDSHMLVSSLTADWSDITKPWFVYRGLKVCPDSD